METDELIKLVDGIYKNILDKFNPGARQMINAGKAYLKSLHNAAAASRLYVDAIGKLAKQAQQGTWGGSSDIGAALMKVVEVYKEIQDQQMNILKAFYVDLLVPLETNLEKDTKVVQSEQKRFLQQHKQRSETYSKAAAIMKKQRKKSRGSAKAGLAMDKELKNMQVLEEEKTKLDAFCEQSLKNAMTQERRRYGFVLERQCSLAKHYLSYHALGQEAINQNLDKWAEVAKTREYLPESVENIFSSRIRQISVWQDEDLYSNPRSPNFEEDRISINSQLRKTKSMDASCLDIKSMGGEVGPATLSRAKSEFNLNSVPQENHHNHHHHTPSRRPKSMAVPPPPTWEAQLARALYAYLSSGDNQLSFHEGDLIALIGERTKGWQFGENLRTQSSGWFPLAYTEVLADEPISESSHSATPTNNVTTTPSTSGGANSEQPNSRMFGDTLHLHRSSNNATKQIRRAIGTNNIPPPAAPAPVPTPSLPAYQKTITQSQSINSFNGKEAQYSAPGIKSSASAFNFSSGNNGPYSTHPAPTRERPSAGNGLPLHLQSKGGKIGGAVGNVSLHSSNDSGFSNDPPPQPEIDYSDDESIHQTKLNREAKKQLTQNRQPTLSHSHGNLMMDDDEEQVARTKVKRTKSFWKFGKNSSDSEILEGMALWRHRDLVDEEEVKPTAEEKPIVVKKTKEEKRKASFKKPEKRVPKKQPEELVEEEIYGKVYIDQFLDDDGLMLKTVNRRHILKQYSDDLTAEESDSPSFSDDPYDCIVVDDQKVQRKHVSNVAEIGKKLEKLSKSSKYSPKKNEQEPIKKKHYYDSTNDELSDVGDNRQFLPRTKLSKANSTESNISLLEYGETLQRRMKNPEGYNEKSMENGNMYGPWYDLWGLDASSTVNRK